MHPLRAGAEGLHGWVPTPIRPQNLSSRLWVRRSRCADPNTAAAASSSAARLPLPPRLHVTGGRGSMAAIMLRGGGGREAHVCMARVNTRGAGGIEAHLGTAWAAVRGGCGGDAHERSGLRVASTSGRGASPYAASFLGRRGPPPPPSAAASSPLRLQSLGRAGGVPRAAPASGPRSRSSSPVRPDGNDSGCTLKRAGRALASARLGRGPGPLPALPASSSSSGGWVTAWGGTQQGAPASPPPEQPPSSSSSFPPNASGKSSSSSSQSPPAAHPTETTPFEVSPPREIKAKVGGARSWTPAMAALWPPAPLLNLCALTSCPTPLNLCELITSPRPQILPPRLPCMLSVTCRIPLSPPLPSPNVSVQTLHNLPQPSSPPG